jgi:aspartyl aminopeptidase
MLYFKQAKKGKYEVTQTTKGVVNFVYTVNAKSKEEALEQIENKVNDPNFEPLEEAEKIEAHPDYDGTSTYIVKEIE